MTRHDSFKWVKKKTIWVMNSKDTAWADKAVTALITRCFTALAKQFQTAALAHAARAEQQRRKP